MAFVINVIKWLLWTVETVTLYKVLGRDSVLSEIYYSVLVRNTCQLHDSQHYDSFYTIVISREWLIEQTLTLCCFNVGPTSSPVAPHEV